MRGKGVFQIGLVFAALSALLFLGKSVPAGGKMISHQPVPEFHDWSTRHLVYSNWGVLPELNSAALDPRAPFSWRQRSPAPDYRLRPRIPIRHRLPNRLQMHRDWIISLGAGGTPVGMYPAKYTFDITQTPSCPNDFVVFPVAAKGSATQPNIVAFNNLYSGTTGGTGICNRTKVASDLGNTATVYWSYNVQGISGGGAVPTSPVISYDPFGTSTGMKVAFVESIAGSAAHFHVLAFKSGDGKNAANLQNVLTPVTIKTFSSTASAAGSGAATDLVLGASSAGSDTLSSPFIDYAHDLAYVGNDVGVLYRIKDVFCPTNYPDCTSATKPAPSLDSSWGTAGAVQVCNGVLTAPVLDYVTMNVYVGCSDGKLYSVSKSGTIKSIVVGDGVASKTYGAIVDPPIVDSSSGFVYAVSGSGNSGANGVLVQAKVDFSSSVTVPIGAGNQCNMHDPVFSNAYYSGPTTAGALVYAAGVTGTVSQPCTAESTGGALDIYGVTFGAGGIMTSGAPAHSVQIGTPGNEFSPLLEFYNTTTSVDWLFLGVLCNPPPNVASANITTGFPAGVGTVVSEGLGTSGMTVDNVANTTTYPQAASVYFNALQENAACTNTTDGTATGGCAVKLTQAALQ